MQLVRTRQRVPRDLGCGMPRRRLPPKRPTADDVAEARLKAAAAGARANNPFAAAAAAFLDWRGTRTPGGVAPPPARPTGRPEGPQGDSPANSPGGLDPK